MVKFINTYHGAGTNSSNLVMYCKKEQKKQKKKMNRRRIPLYGDLALLA